MAENRLAHPVQAFGDLVKDQGRVSPFVKWAGGKSQLLPDLVRYRPRSIATYLEPFVGGGALFFALAPSRAIIADANPELMAAYRTVQRDPESLMRELDELQPYGADEEFFENQRRKDPSKLPELKRAARFIFLNKTCFNGLYRVNSRGQFNTPFNHNKKAPRLYDRGNILACNKALAGKLIVQGDYRDVSGYARSGDFVYFDPPYQPLTPSSSFTSYTADDFDFEDQCRLAAVVDQLADAGCNVMVSNSAHPEIEKLYAKRHYVHRLRARRAINSDKNGRGKVDELLILTYKP